MDILSCNDKAARIPVEAVADGRLENRRHFILQVRKDFIIQ